MLFDNDKKPKLARYKKHRIRRNMTRYRFQDFAFSGLNPGYEIPLMQEIFGMRTIVGFTMDEILDLPIQDRRYFTILHNEKVERENEEMKGGHSLHDMGAVKQMKDQADSARNGGMPNLNL